MNKKIDDYTRQPAFKEEFSLVLNLQKQLVRDLGWQPDREKDTDSAIEIYVHWKEDFKFLTIERLRKALTDAVLQRRITKLAKAEWYMILQEANSLAKKETSSKLPFHLSELERLQSDYDFLKLVWEVIVQKEPKVGRGSTLAGFIQRYDLKIPDGVWREVTEVRVPKVELSRKEQLLGRGLNAIIHQNVSPFETACMEYWRLDLDLTRESFLGVETEIKEKVRGQLSAQSA